MAILKTNSEIIGKKPKAMHIVALIPARGGSKGIPRKNIKLLNGYPLIRYTIDCAKKVSLISKDSIYVSSDDDEILNISKDLGANIIKRPEEYATDKANIGGAVLHALNYVEKNKGMIDLMILLPPTAPLRTPQDIENAITTFLASDAESLISVKETEDPPFWNFTIDEDKQKLKPLFGREYLYKRRQDLPKVYSPCGSIYISTPYNIRKYKGFYGNDLTYLVIDSEHAIDIDTMDDWNYAEFLLEKKKKKKNLK